MPIMANIVVKNKANADVTYTGVAGSAGDRNPAVFRNDTVGTTPAERPTFLITSRDNGPKTARRLDHSFIWPQFVTDVMGRKIRDGGAAGSGSLIIPQTLTVAQIEAFVYEYTGLLASALIRQACVEGNAPRG